MPPTTRKLAAGPCTGAEPHARRREARQRRVVAELLAAGESVVVDTPPEVCTTRNEARAGRARVPPVGVHATRARFAPPIPDEGFDRIDVVPGQDGTEAEGNRPPGV